MFTRKNLLVVYLISTLLILVLAGCGGAPNASSPDSAKAAPGAFKVAMVLPGEANDGAWSQAGYEGLKLIEKELGAQVAHSVNITEADAEKIFRQYAQDGYDFIIGHGGEYIPAAEVVAKEFPRTKFALMAGYGGNNKNLGALSFRDSEIGYLMGAVAGIKTKTNKLAFIGGVDYPHMQEQATSFERGAKAANPKVEVAIEWVGSWTDEAKTKQIAEAQVKAGADVLVGNVDAASQAVFETAKNAGVYALGWSLDQHDMAPNTILTSGIQRMPVLALEGATLVQQGRWEGKQYKFGLQEGAQELAPFYGLLSPEEEARVKTVREDIVTGKIDVTQ
ncbi:MAG: BMP family protein [Anaerolineales bacterium]|nr:BMP family protein [Anaerolineales bacterium]